MKFIPLFLITILFIRCGQELEESPFQVLDISSSFSQKEEVKLSKFVDKVSFVPIETNPDILIGQNARYEVTDSFIIVKNVGLGQTDQILLFDRNNGKLIREIGKPGRGPGEYNMISFIPYNNGKRQIYARGSSLELIVYDISGKFIETIGIPSVIDPKAPSEFFSKRVYTPDIMLDSNTFVSYADNSLGWEDKKLVIYTKDKIIKVFPNYLTWDRKDWNRITYMKFANFYHWNDNLYFIEAFCDTLYKVTKDELIPRYYFDFGNFKASYSKQEEIVAKELSRNYFFLYDIDENKDYIFFQLAYDNETYTGFVDKNKSNVTFCETGTSDKSGLKDDINNLMDVVPLDFTQNNEMVYIIQPSELFKWFEENPEEAKLAKAKNDWLKDINELSNPIIVIAKCK
jgi:hypothetical protein